MLVSVPLVDFRVSSQCYGSRLESGSVCENGRRTSLTVEPGCLSSTEQEKIVEDPLRWVLVVYEWNFVCPFGMGPRGHPVRTTEDRRVDKVGSGRSPVSGSLHRLGSGTVNLRLKSR